MFEVEVEVEVELELEFEFAFDMQRLCRVGGLILWEHYGGIQKRNTRQTRSKWCDTL